MDWFVVKDTENDKIMINSGSIMSIRYNAETNLTTVEFIRAAYPAVYVRGDITPHIKRLLNAHEHYVSNIGGI